jgi:hypothetical protein
MNPTIEHALQQIYRYAAPFVTFISEDNDERYLQLLDAVLGWEVSPYEGDEEPPFYTFAQARAEAAFVRSELFPEQQG